MEELEEFSEKEESNFDLKAEIYRYLAFWKWLVLGCLLGLVLAFLYNRYTLRAYVTEATMMILSDEDTGLVGALPSGGASVFSLEESNLQNQIVTLTSKKLVEGVIDELDLNITYFLEGNVIAVEAYEHSPIKIHFLTEEDAVHQEQMNVIVTPLSNEAFSLSVKDTDDAKIFQFGEPVEYERLRFTIERVGDTIQNETPINILLRPLRDVANDYISRMSIVPKAQAQDVLSLSIISEVPQKSQDFLNTLMRHFNADGVADKRQVAETTTEFIQSRLKLISGELDSVEGDIADFKRTNQLMDISASAGQTMARSTMAEQEIFGLETDLMVLDAVEETLVSIEPYQLLPEASGTGDNPLGSGIAKYNELVLERNEFLKTGTAQNPVVQSLTMQLDALKKLLLNNLAQTRKSIRIKIEELSALDSWAEGKFSTFPGLEKGIRTIERQQQIKEQLYLFLLQRMEEAAISFASTAPVAKVIDPAFTYTEPVDPKPWLIMVGGGVIGLLIPLLIIFVINFLDTKVHHKGDLQPLIKNIPFLGEVPKVVKEQSEVIGVNDRSPLAESFRILRTNLAYLVQSRNKERAETIFVTSTIKGEGKTFISYNLARTLASTGKRILLIGADIRNPKLHKYSGETLETKGLSDFLYDYDVQSQEIISNETHEGIAMDIIYSGAIPPNPAELLMNDRMKVLLTSQEKNYDFIVVDTAPTMIVTDTLLISPLADTTIYVTRAGFTEKKLLEFPKELKQQGKLKGLAIVLNDVDYSKFSYGAKYGYAYGYGYGYGADKEKGGIFKFLKKPFKS